MAKIKSTLTGGSTVNHKKAYDRVHHREDCVGTTRNGDHVYAQVNSHPLDSMIESESVRTTNRYDWKTGEFKKEKLDVLENSHLNITTLKVRPVTNARAREYTDKGYGIAGNPGMCYPSAPTGRRK
jgi:hypothetical protein